MQTIPFYIDQTGGLSQTADATRELTLCVIEALVRDRRPARPHEDLARVEDDVGGAAGDPGGRADAPG